nr:MAG: hypothetical protein [Microvirus sp.]
MPIEGQEPVYENDTFEDIDNPQRDPNYDITDLQEYIDKVERKKFYSSKHKDNVSEANTITGGPEKLSSAGLPEEAGAGEAKAPKRPMESRTGDNFNAGHSEAGNEKK